MARLTDNVSGLTLIVNVEASAKVEEGREAYIHGSNRDT